MDRLGLVYDDAPRELPLGEGLVFVFRPPTSIDWGIARARVTGVLEAQGILAEAARRYAWSTEDCKAVLEEQESAAVAADHMILSELATRIVTEVRGPGGTVEPVLEHFCELFRRGENLAVFKSAVEKADRDLIRAKKE